MLTECLDRLRRVRRVAVDLYHAGSESKPALESHTAQGAGPELDAEASHHGSCVMQELHRVDIRSEQGAVWRTRNSGVVCRGLATGPSGVPEILGG